MKAVFLRTCALMAAAWLAACNTMQAGGDGRGGAEVTRFHLGQPVARGQIAVEAFDPADANLPEFRSYQSSVQRQLSRLGWTVVNAGGGTEQVALIDVQQGSSAALRGGRMGVGGGAPATTAAAGNAVGTKLEVRIKRRSEGTVFWEGRAMSEAGAGGSAESRTAAVEKLAEALFRDFPGESGRTIRLR